MILGLVPGVVLTTKAADLCVELLVQLDRTQTPEAAFRSLTDALDALLRAKHALEAELNAKHALEAELNAKHALEAELNARRHGQ